MNFTRIARTLGDNHMTIMQVLIPGRPDAQFLLVFTPYFLCAEPAIWSFNCSVHFELGSSFIPIRFTWPSWSLGCASANLVVRLFVLQFVIRSHFVLLNLAVFTRTLVPSCVRSFWCKAVGRFALISVPWSCVPSSVSLFAGFAFRAFLCLSSFHSKL